MSTYPPPSIHPSLYLYLSSGTRLAANQQGLTLQFRAAVSATVILTVGGAVHHLWDADQELAIVPQDHHGQLAPALLHQVLGLQQRQVFRRHAVDLVKEDQSGR